MLANILLMHVVIIYCSIFPPLLLTALSVNLVVLLTLSCVTVPQPSYYLSIISFSRSRVQLCDCPPFPTPQLLVGALQLCSTAKRDIKSLSFLSGIKLLVAQTKRFDLTSRSLTGVRSTSFTSIGRRPLFITSRRPNISARHTVHTNYATKSVR